MSWFGHTFLVVVQDVCLVEGPQSTEPEIDTPSTVAELARRCEPVDRQVASFVRTRYTDETLPELYGWAGLVPEA